MHQMPTASPSAKVADPYRSPWRHGCPAPCQRRTLPASTLGERHEETDAHAGPGQPRSRQPQSPLANSHHESGDDARRTATVSSAGLGLVRAGSCAVQAMTAHGSSVDGALGSHAARGSARRLTTTRPAAARSADHPLLRGHVMTRFLNCVPIGRQPVAAEADRRRLARLAMTSLVILACRPARWGRSAAMVSEPRGSDPAPTPDRSTSRRGHQSASPSRPAQRPYRSRPLRR